MIFSKAAISTGRSSCSACAGMYPSGVGRSAACLLKVPVLGLHGVEDTVGSERFDRIDEIEAAMEAEPFSGVAMPLNVEAVGADPVEASEGRVELLAEIFREAGAVALDEAILGAMPFAEDIDGIVELRRPAGRQETRLQEFVDESFAGCGNASPFGLGECGAGLKRLAHGSQSPFASSTAATRRADEPDARRCT